MKTGTVKYSEEFISAIGLKKWRGIELEYNIDTEDPLEVFNKAEKIVSQSQLNSQTSPIINPIFPDPGWQPSVHQPLQTISVQRTSEDTRIAELVRDIYACTELDGDNGLWSYSKLATTCKEAELAYDVMIRKLRAKESRELLDKCKPIATQKQ